MFGWIRSKVKAAVLAGVEDALAWLEQRGGPPAEGAERLLEERLAARALPPADGDAAAGEVQLRSGRRKAGA